MRRPAPGTATLVAGGVTGSLALVLACGVAPRTAVGAFWILALAAHLGIAATLQCWAGWRWLQRGPAARALPLAIAGGALAGTPCLLFSVAVLGSWWQGGLAGLAYPGTVVGTLVLTAVPVLWTVALAWHTLSRRPSAEESPTAPAPRPARRALVAAAVLGSTMVVGSTATRWGVGEIADHVAFDRDDGEAQIAAVAAGPPAVPALARLAADGGGGDLGTRASRIVAHWLHRVQDVYDLEGVVEIVHPWRARQRGATTLARIAPEGQQVLADWIGQPDAERSGRAVEALATAAQVGSADLAVSLTPSAVAHLLERAGRAERRTPTGGEIWDTAKLFAVIVLVNVPEALEAKRALARGLPGSNASTMAAGEFRRRLERDAASVADVLALIDTDVSPPAMFAKRAIRGLGPESTAAMPALRAALDSPRWGVRAAALAGFAQLGPAAAGERARIEKMRDDPHAVVRAATRAALRAVAIAPAGD